MAEDTYLSGSRTEAAEAAMIPPFPDPVQPEALPFRVVKSPAHLSIEIWQSSYYDATSHAPMGAFTQRPAGPCDLVTGRLLDGEWPSTHGLWGQV